MTESFAGKNYWMLVGGLAILGVLLQRFLPAISMEVGGYAIEILDMVMGAFVLMLFLFSGIDEEKTYADTLKQIAPVLIFALVVPAFFGVSIDRIIFYIVLIMIIPLIGKFIAFVVKGKFITVLGAKKGERREELVSALGGEDEERKKYRKLKNALEIQKKELGGLIYPMSGWGTPYSPQAAMPGQSPPPPPQHYDHIYNIGAELVSD